MPPETTEAVDGQVDKKVLEAGAAAAIAADQADAEKAEAEQNNSK